MRYIQIVNQLYKNEVMNYRKSTNEINLQMYNLTLNAEYKTNINNYTRINTSKNSQKTSMKPG